jgi:hypothetical protein
LATSQTCPLAQTAVQTPFAQLCPSPQETPHAPQLLLSVAGSTQPVAVPQWRRGGMVPQGEQSTPPSSSALPVHT